MGEVKKERMERKKWIYIRDHDSGALAEFRRAREEKVTRNCLNLPDWQPPCAPFPRTGHCSHERANHSSNNNPSHLSASSHLAQRAFVRFFSAACGWFVLLAILARHSLYFQSSLLFYFYSLISICGAVGERSSWKLHESRITSYSATTCKVQRLLIRDIIGSIISGFRHIFFKQDILACIIFKVPLFDFTVTYFQFIRS